MAFKMSPMVITFMPSGSKATQVLTLENSGGDKVPVQIEAFVRGVDAKGEETRAKTSDFNIYPEQLVLLPNEKRNVRVTWAGEMKDGNEKSYRIIASQIPVEFKETNAKSKKPGVNLNFLLQYVASAYVTPDKASANVKVKEARALPGKKVQVVLVNDGSAHKVLHPKKIKFISGKSTVLEIEKPKEIEGANLLAKTEMKFVLSVSKDLPKDIKAEIELSEIGD
ncbi:MAG TPA: fimbria/pilus periplasmic chaperone [Bdellovibrio sp.]